MKHRAWFVTSSVFTMALVAFVAMSRSLEARQGQASANMQVSATVIRKCTITTQPLAFGNYDPVQANFTAPLDAQTTLSVACTKGTAVSIGMNNGNNPSGVDRRMTSGGSNFLEYEIYKDASRVDPWMNTGPGMLSGGVAPSRDPRQFIVYGRVPGGQDVTEGAFQDTVVVTVQF
jgi:spore coat protein U-like protein